MIEGVYTALITPFKEDGSLDDEGLEKLLFKQMEAKVSGVVLLGTTGEAPTLTSLEKEIIIKKARSILKSPCQCIIGTGTNATATSIEETKRAEALGADAALVVTPYYNKPTQEGFFKHFEALVKNTSLPLIVYNIQGRTAQNLETKTLKRLLTFENIVSIKEASGQISQIMEVIDAIKDYKKFTVLSGDDCLTLPLMAVGGHGVISVLSNLVPEKIVHLYNACKLQNFEKARQIHYELFPLFKGAFIETNPIPIKQIMEWNQLPAGPCRLPLCSLTDENKKLLKNLYG